ncbi:hypothetical protein LJC72_06600 [Bacteroides sp. OttesenSCG-928-D19]|nr:hypothetical protein [Bacteroides sp. OttesenSCG-928-D19]
MDLKLHVISFQVPYPPTYGGVIDVYYKLKLLKEAGVSIILHTFQYDHAEAPELCNVVDTVYYYPRKTGWASLFSLLPYTVYTRKSKQLINNLLLDNYPILFEGIHTCYILNDKRLSERIKLVRMHNIESVYYNQLAASAINLQRKCFYRLESAKLSFYEKRLNNADAILPITPYETEFFSKMYPNKKVLCVECFYDDTVFSNLSTSVVNADYVLFQADLSVDANVRAALFVLDEVLPILPKDIPLIFAGKNPTDILCRKAKCCQQVKIFANPSEEEMNNLLVNARINLLLSFHNTGIKLKLLYALVKSRGYCLANSTILEGTSLHGFCQVADDATEMASAIIKLFSSEQTVDAVARRNSVIQLYSNVKNVNTLLAFL